MADGGGDGGVLKDEGGGHALGTAGGGIVIGHAPLRRAGQRPGDVCLVVEEGLGSVTIQDDVEVAAAVGEILGEESICVAEFGDADLGNQINGRGGIEKRGASQVEP